MLKIKRVIVGLSGGVDSAVTALLLKNKGFDVHGVFMQNWDIADEQGQCSADKDFKDASIVCEKLGIQLHYVNFVKHYWHYVFSNLVKDYETGYTPNPDILCNRHIKFDYFIRHVRENLNADAVATGHYANTSFGCYLENYKENEKVRLLRASCIHKDQTFFLSQVKEESLRHIMFPLGNLMKSEVKQIAQDNGLTHVAAKKESMGICFIGNRKFQSFISEYIENKPGNFVDLDTNKKVGEHQGIHQWTIGQRSRLGYYPKLLYVARKVIKNNNIFVVNGWGHAALFSDIFITSKAHWIHSEPEELINDNIFECEFKFQHVEILRKCSMCQTKNGLIVTLQEPIRALTAGQYAVFYKDNECLGSARITYPGPSEYFMRRYQINKNKRKKNSEESSDCVNISKDEENVNCTEDEEEIKVRNVA